MFLCCCWCIFTVLPGSCLCSQLLPPQSSLIFSSNTSRVSCQSSLHFMLLGQGQVHAACDHQASCCRFLGICCGLRCADPKCTLIRTGKQRKNRGVSHVSPLSAAFYVLCFALFFFSFLCPLSFRLLLRKKMRLALSDKVITSSKA